jgi:hypothetical protein
MTSDGISSEDWDRVHELALDIVNASDAERIQNVERLFAFLQGLTSKYGDLPSIVATQADYTDDPHASEQLLLRAFDLAIARNDQPNIREIALSLADLYATDLRQKREASRWLEIAKTHIRHDNEMDKMEYQRIEESMADIDSTDG